MKRYTRTKPLMKTAFSMALFLMILFSSPVRAEVVDRIVAVINNEIITLYELRKDMAPYVMQLQQSGLRPEQAQQKLYLIREKVLDQMISQKLSAQEAKRLKVQVSNGEVDAAIENFKKMRMLTDEQLREALARDGISVEDFREQWRSRILRNKLVTWEVRSKIVVTDEEIKEYYEANKDKYEAQASYHIKNMAVPLSRASSSKVKEDARKLLDDTREQILAAGSFDVVEKDLKQNNSRIGGGDLGFFDPNQLTPVLRDAVVGMKAGQVSPVLDTDAGMQILWVEEVKETGGLTLEEARLDIQNEIYKEIIDKRYAQWLQKLKDGTFIKKIR